MLLPQAASKISAFARGRKARQQAGALPKQKVDRAEMGGESPKQHEAALAGADSQEAVRVGIEDVRQADSDARREETANEVAVLAAQSVDETLSLFYVNLVVLNAKQVANDKIIETINKKIPYGAFGIVQKRAGRAAAFVAREKVSHILISKLSENLCLKLQTQMAEAAGLVVSVAVAFVVQGSAEGDGERSRMCPMCCALIRIGAIATFARDRKMVLQNGPSEGPHTTLFRLPSRKQAAPGCARRQNPRRRSRQDACS